MFNLRSIDVNVDNQTAWVQTGATLGDVYYRIAEKSRNLGYPAGVCHTVGVGGLFSGGGHGFLTRKYGLASDNIIDARIVDVNGRILNRKSMGEDLFWAIRGAGAADKLNEDLFIRITIEPDSANRTINAVFQSMYLGGVDKLLQLMEQSFPELGLKKKDCIQMSWIESVLYFNGLPNDKGLEVLLERNQPKTFYKAKSDYVKEPISETVLEGIWKRFHNVEIPMMVLFPYGGKMKEISKYETPYPHREGNIYVIQYIVYWTTRDGATEKRINWIKELYSYMTPYVSKSPREAYVNYRDLDLGTNKNGHTNY
ncbi:hypothetical protein NE237_030444 [Protea cynaroides]|uniref:FAD-binding PCMH-type domain-containing protein n=1 Tax=Protea cynaroides TaxID=273540 RepID=A0A9Q0JW23_9MAGN|nr:hypothetical protein NE237_030444 [Protea cynaroides]